jgi:hypothetical protein
MRMTCYPTVDPLWDINYYSSEFGNQQRRWQETKLLIVLSLVMYVFASSNTKDCLIFLYLS